uniref:TRAF-type domain-containing protein n=1 Tax=Strigamia maritima TaxID=126957 RepID=T1II15_STRMM
MSSNSSGKCICDVCDSVGDFFDFKEESCRHLFCPNCILKSDENGVVICTLKHILIKQAQVDGENKSRLKFCVYCRGFYLSTDTETHYENCDMYPADCDLNCGRKYLRSQMENHLQECPKNLQTCKFASLGCHFTGSPLELSIHETDKIHCELLMNELSSLITDKIEFKKSANLAMAAESDTSEQKREIKECSLSLKKIQEDLQNFVEKQKIETEWCKERIVHLESKQNVDVHIEDKKIINVLDETMENMKKQLELILNKQNLNQTAFEAHIEETMNKFQQVNGEVTELLKSLAQSENVNKRYEKLNKVVKNSHSQLNKVPKPKSLKLEIEALITKKCNEEIDKLKSSLLV